MATQPRDVTRTTVVVNRTLHTEGCWTRSVTSSPANKKPRQSARLLVSVIAVPIWPVPLRK